MITSNSNSRIKQIIQWQTKVKARNADGVFVVEGPRMFREAPTDRVVDTFVAESYLPKAAADGIDLDKIKYETVSDSVFAAISDTQTPQGILTVCRRPEYTMPDLMKPAYGPEPLLLLLEDLQDPGNLGTIMRTAEGAGVSGVIFSKGCVDIYNPKVVRATMGSIYRVPFLTAEDFRGCVSSLRNQGVRIYAAHLAGTKGYGEFDFTGATGFLIGNEGNGLTEETARLATDYLLIPMEGRLESLNAAVAAAILMYEGHRQRHIK